MTRASPPKNRITRIATYLILLAEDHLLLVKLGKGPHTGAWGLPGGGIEFGEDPTDALERELMEEAGLSLKNFDLFMTTSTRSVWKTPERGQREEVHNIGIIHVKRLEKMLPAKADPDGSSSLGCRWIKIADLPTSPLNTTSRIALERYFGRRLPKISV